MSKNFTLRKKIISCISALAFLGCSQFSSFAGDFGAAPVIQIKNETELGKNENDLLKSGDISEDDIGKFGIKDGVETLTLNDGTVMFASKKKAIEEYDGRMYEVDNDPILVSECGGYMIIYRTLARTKWFYTVLPREKTKETLVSKKCNPCSAVTAPTQKGKPGDNISGIKTKWPIIKNPFDKIKSYCFSSKSWTAIDPKPGKPNDERLGEFRINDMPVMWNEDMSDVLIGGEANTKELGPRVLVTYDFFKNHIQKLYPKEVKSGIPTQNWEYTPRASYPATSFTSHANEKKGRTNFTILKIITAVAVGATAGKICKEYTRPKKKLNVIKK